MPKRRFNIQAETLNIDPATIPDIVSKEQLSIWQDGDAEPYYKIQRIDYPLKAKGVFWQESFFKEFLDVMNTAPIPGSRSGHETKWGAKGPTDFVMIGGKLDSKGNGEGSVYFKNYIPPAGEQGNNDNFKKELQTNMIHFSLVSFTRDERVEGTDGEWIWNVVGHVKGARNDAVELGLGAMEQKTNAEEEGDNNMTKKELLDKLAVLKQNGDISINEIAGMLGVGDQLKSGDERVIIRQMSDIRGLIGKDSDPVVWVKDQIKHNKDMADKVAAAVLTENFGPEGTEKEPNLRRQMAATLIAGREITPEVIEAVKNDPLYKHVCAGDADTLSPENQIVEPGGKIKDDENKTSGGRKVDTL